MVKYYVDVESDFPRTKDHFAKLVAQILNDPRSWKVNFQEVNSKQLADMRIYLVKSNSVTKICGFTGLSCADRGPNNIYINGNRWLHGSKKSKMNLTNYRRYLINHEVGHLLGFDHLTCARAGCKSPVMLQQTLGVGKCLPNPWPTKSEQTKIPQKYRTKLT